MRKILVKPPPQIFDLPLPPAGDPSGWEQVRRGVWSSQRILPSHRGPLGKPSCMFCAHQGSLTNRSLRSHTCLCCSSSKSLDSKRGGEGSGAEWWAGRQCSGGAEGSGAGGGLGSVSFCCLRCSWCKHMQGLLAREMPFPEGISTPHEVLLVSQSLS